MADNTDNSGPVFRFEWTFPLFRVVSGKAGTVKSKIGSMRGSSVDENVPQTLSAAVDDEESTSYGEEDDGLSDLRDRLDTVTESSINVSQEDNDNHLISFGGDVLLPVESEIDVGSVVEFVNKTGGVVTIMLSGGGSIEVEDSTEVTFDEEGVFNLNVSGFPEEEVCGAIVVGNPEEEPELPCRDNTEVEAFEEETGSPDATVDIEPPKSMSDAADDKERSFR